MYINIRAATIVKLTNFKILKLSRICRLANQYELQTFLRAKLIPTLLC